MEFQGRVIQFIGEKSGTSKAGNPWKKKEWVVETFGQYPKKVKIQCFGERSDAMNLEPGKDYTLFVDLESREFNGNWYTDVSVYRAEEYSGQAPQQPGAYHAQQPQTPFGGGGMPYTAPQGGFSPDIPANDSDEDLPF